MSPRSTILGTAKEVRFLTPYPVGIGKMSNPVHRIEIEMVPIADKSEGARHVGA